MLLHGIEAASARCRRPVDAGLMYDGPNMSGVVERVSLLAITGPYQRF